jgi:hypothetical protein
LLDDIVSQHKGRLARIVVGVSGDVDKLPVGQNFAALVSHAAGRGITLLAAAHEVLKEINDTAKGLIDSEQLKDAITYKIARVKSFEDIEMVAKAIASLSLNRNQEIKSPALDEVALPENLITQKSDKRIPDRSVHALTQRRKAVLSLEPKLAETLVIARYPSIDLIAMQALAKKGLPFIVQGIVGQWPIAKLKLKGLVQQFGHLAVVARRGDYVADAFSTLKSVLQTTLSQFIAEALTRDSASPELPPYLGNQVLPQLMELCDWPRLFGQTAEAKIWVGPANTITPLHCDYDDNLFAQILGEKKFILYPPWNAEFLHLRQINPVLYASSFDPENPEFLTFPNAKNAHRIDCHLDAGELLFLPSGWFHQVHAKSFSLSANLWGYDTPYSLSGR